MNQPIRVRTARPTRAPDEARLAAAARRGDREAFERLAVREMPHLIGTARRLLGRGFAAEEAVAEALFRALRGIADFRGDAGFGTWLHRIVCRVAGDRYREAARERRHRQAWAQAAPLPAPAFGPFEQAVGREQAARLRASVETLPPRQRLVLLLHAWEGMTLREIARVLRLRYATVKSNLCHARAAVRRRLLAGDG